MRRRDPRSRCSSSPRPTVSTISAVLVVRYGARPTLSAGFVLIALGVGGVERSRHGRGPRGDHGVRLWTRPGAADDELSRGRRESGKESSAVSLVNVSWSAGAVTWPLLVTWLGTTTSVLAPMLLLSALMLALVVRLRLAGRQTTPRVSVPKPAHSARLDTRRSRATFGRRMSASRSSASSAD